MNPVSEARRRSLLALAAAAFGGCASKPGVAPKPIALLGIEQAQTIVRPPARLGPMARATPIPAGGGGAGVLAGVLGGLAAGAVHDVGDAKAAALWQAYALLAIDFAAELQRRLLAALQALDTPTLLRADHESAPEPRPVPDSWLALSVREAGYYADRNAGGFTPYLGVRLWLKGRGDQDDDLMSQRYYADYRADAPGDRRFFTTPPEMSLRRLEDLPEHLETARSGFALVMDRMVAQMVLDVRQRMRGAEVI